MGRSPGCDRVHDCALMRAVVAPRRESWSTSPGGDLPLMEIVRITDVSLAAGCEDEVAARELIHPQPFESSDVHAIRFQGAVVVRYNPAAVLEICSGLAEIDCVRTRFPRPDLRRRFPEIPWAGKRSGFRFEISTLRLPRYFTLTPAPVLHNQTPIPFATVRGTREPQPLPV